MKINNKDKFVKGKIFDFNETKGYFIGRFVGEKGFQILKQKKWK